MAFTFGYISVGALRNSRAHFSKRCAPVGARFCLAKCIPACQHFALVYIFSWSSFKPSRVIQLQNVHVATILFEFMRYRRWIELKVKHACQHFPSVYIFSWSSFKPSRVVRQVLRRRSHATKVEVQRITRWTVPSMARLVIRQKNKKLAFHPLVKRPSTTNVIIQFSCLCFNEECILELSFGLFLY